VPGETPCQARNCAKTHAEIGRSRTGKMRVRRGYFLGDARADGSLPRDVDAQSRSIIAPTSSSASDAFASIESDWPATEIGCRLKADLFRPLG
jgi:hypothetical protein